MIDPNNYLTLILFFLAIVISSLAQAKVRSTYSKQSKNQSSTNLTGSSLAREILDSHGLSQVKVERIKGQLTDHYDPRDKILRLSEGVYGKSSIAALAIASHECGHAIQHAEEYRPLEIRSMLVPIVSLANRFTWFLVFIGLILSMPRLVDIGIIFFLASIVFSLVTLPVEFNASKRAINILSQDYLPASEVAPAKDMLSAAAFTYVAASLVGIIQLLRLLLISRRRD